MSVRSLLLALALPLVALVTPSLGCDTPPAGDGDGQAWPHRLQLGKPCCELVA